MKAHGISNNTGGGRAGGSPTASGPSTPTIPAARKTQANSRTSTAKKRKLATRGDDLDDEVKTEVKAEVKNEVNNDDDADGSYMTYPTESPLDAAAPTLVAMPSHDYRGGNIGTDDEVLVVSETRMEYGRPITPVAFMQQMLMPPPPENFYGFVDNPVNDICVPSPAAIAVTSAPYSQKQEADYSMQTRTPSELATGHWLLHQNAGFF